MKIMIFLIIKLFLPFSSLYRGDLENHDLVDHLEGGYNGGGMDNGHNGDLGMGLDHDGGNGDSGNDGGVRSYAGGRVKKYKKGRASVLEINV